MGTSEHAAERRAPPTAMAPPTIAGPIPVARPRSSALEVLGVITLVCGGLALVGGLFQAVAWLLLMIGLCFPGSRSAWWTWYTGLSALVITALAALALVAGAGLACRQAWGRGVALWWAVLKILLVVATVPVTLAAQRQQLQAQAVPAVGVAAMNVTGPFFAVLVAAWGAALPVVLLVWLNRASERARVEAWRQGMDA